MRSSMHFWSVLHHSRRSLRRPNDRNGPKRPTDATGQELQLQPWPWPPAALAPCPAPRRGHHVHHKAQSVNSQPSGVSARDAGLHTGLGLFGWVPAL